MPELRKPRTKVPKAAYSEKFRQLPYRQKLAVRRNIGKTTLAMQTNAKKLDDRLQKWYSGLGEKHSTDDINRRKLELIELRKEFDQLTTNFLKFTDSITPYFTELNYHHGLRSFHAINPIELKLHITSRIFEKIQTFLENAEN